MQAIKPLVTTLERERATLFATAFRTFALAHHPSLGRVGADALLNIAGPFSLRFDPQRIEQDIERANGLEDLADLGFQALNPGPRRARGASEVCCTSAWKIWAAVQWMVSAAPDHTMVTLRKSGSQWDGNADDQDVPLPSEAFAAWQGTIAKRLLKALALPTSLDDLVESLNDFQRHLHRDLHAWAQEHHPECLSPHRNWRTRVELNRLDGQTEVVGPDHNVDEELVRQLMGEDFIKTLNHPETFEEVPSFTSFCDQQKVGMWWGASDSTSEMDRHQALVDRLLAPEEHTLTGLGTLLANRYGLRAVSIHPVGGARRAQQELVRAVGAFEALAKASGLPTASVGLNGLHLRVAATTVAWSRGGSTKAFFRANGARGIRSRLHPGEMVFTAPFDVPALAHEWTHAWDHHLEHLVQPLLLDDQRQALTGEFKRLRSVLSFEAPVFKTTTTTYRKSKEKAFQRLLWDSYDVGHEEFVTITCALRGTQETKARAAQGLRPAGFERALHNLWSVLREGSEKTIRAALQPILANFVGLTEDMVPPETFAMQCAYDLVVARRSLQAARAVQTQHPEWGPMRWEAALLDQARNAKESYWLAPREMMARAAETFFSNDPMPNRPSHQSMTPWGEEAVRASEAFLHFFQAARPVFTLLAQQRTVDGPAHPMILLDDTVPWKPAALRQPRQDRPRRTLSGR